MNRRTLLTTGLALAALTTFVIPITPTHAADDMAAQVQGAETAADHEALAEAHKGAPATSGGKSSGASAMPQHCESLAKNFDAEAEHYKAMAQTHRDLAKTAQ